jgi:hypothetical protein
VVRPAHAPCDARAALSWDCGALRGQGPARRDGHGFRRPAGVSTPSGQPRAGRSERVAPPGALRAPSASLQRSIAAPPHRPGSKRTSRRTMLPPLGSRAPRHMPARRSVSAGRPSPQRAAGGLGTSFATMTSAPPETLRSPSVHGLHPSRLSPRTGRTPSREPLPSGRCPRRFASPLKERADAAGFRASIPATSSFRPSCPCGRDASMPSWASSLQSVLPLRPGVRFGSRTLPHHALGGNDVPSRLRLEVLRSGGIGLPLSGLPALLGFLTLRPSRRPKGRAGGGLMDSPHGSRRVRAPNRSEPPRDRPEPRG